jgi:hypothetical protein
MRILERFYFPFFMALFMSGLMSFQLLIIANGLSNDLFIIWINTWPKAFLVAFPSAILVTPLISKICMFLNVKPQTNSIAGDTHE